jgi:hypothetical protein
MLAKKTTACDYRVPRPPVRNCALDGDDERLEMPQTGLPVYGIDAVKPPSTGIA